jgi:hypothetical protein
MSKKENFVMIGVPTHDGRVATGTFTGLLDAGKTPDTTVGYHFLTNSLLARGFNDLLCFALNHREQGVTHFLLHHADIAIKTEGWLGKMLELMETHQADVLSAVVPLKSTQGLTSTAIEVGDPYPIRRYTMREVFAGPETFTHEKILLNTGVMLLNLSVPWVEEIVFQMKDEIVVKNGKFAPQTLSEDWFFSKWARDKHNARLFATRAIQLDHIGVHPFPNGGPWGTCHTEKV